jgi:hypothetical protein
MTLLFRSTGTKESLTIIRGVKHTIQTKQTGSLYHNAPTLIPERRRSRALLKIHIHSRKIVPGFKNSPGSRLDVNE